jgi:hypothetical protein
MHRQYGNFQFFDYFCSVLLNDSTVETALEKTGLDRETGDMAYPYPKKYGGLR